MKIDNFTFYLDFDGVMADSAQECIKTSFDAWLKYNKKILEMNAKTDFESFRNLITNNALKYRYLVTPPNIIIVLLTSLLKKCFPQKKN